MIGRVKNGLFRMNIHRNANIKGMNSEIRGRQNKNYSYFSYIRAMSKNELKRQLKN